MNSFGVKVFLFLGALLSLATVSWKCGVENINKQTGSTNPQNIIKLPPPVFKSGTSVEEALQKRRSIRNYKDDPLEMTDISQLLWAAQGITANDGGRTAPSAGALYPLEVYVVSGNINGIYPGVYHYLPSSHSLELTVKGDMRDRLNEAAVRQGSVRRCAAVMVITANYERITAKYRERGVRFAHLEAGHVAQNICLQSVSLNIGTVTVGAFTDSQVKQVLQLPANEEPLYLMPLGKRK